MPKLGEIQKEWLAEAKKQGWSIRLTGRGHMLLCPPEGSEDMKPVTVPARGFKDNRGLKNAKAQLKRHGLDID